uniref:Interferon regulatory factor 7 variant 2 n=1 Tax=Takifugu obscurus TaxID=309541 RepID=A0A889ZB30_TAKOB|nr:interferon regulatory factor 7 variant 2 [Takifugu obscurus]
MCPTSFSKPQFASWLIEQVETGQYLGLRYVDENKFRVPWKHNSRKDCNDEDNKIFRAWAVASGKINDFPNDKARWKTNFRSALYNLSERFKMVQDNSKNSDDPHKIYQIINTGCKYENLPTQSSQEDSDMDIYSPPVKPFTLQSELNLHNDFTALDLGDQPAEEQPWAENYTIQYCPADLGGYPAAAEIHPQPMADKPSQYEVNLPQAILSPVQPDIYDLEISIHYRKREMLRTTVRAPRVQLHYHSEAPELKAHHHICFPPTEGLLDHKQIEYTNRILNSIQKGLLLEVRDTGIYATRQDRCHVFASTSDPSVAHPEPSKLPQNNIVELLSFAKYVHELKLFKENNGGSPEYTINMCFGEKFPDGKALEKKLVSVKVVPLICQHLHEMAHLEGASSLHSSSISLQMSHNSLFDLINSVFGLPMADQELA